MGYLSKDADLQTPEHIKENLNRHKGNYYMMQLIQSFGTKNPRKLVEFN